MLLSLKRQLILGDDFYSRQVKRNSLLDSCLVPVDQWKIFDTDDIPIRYFDELVTAVTVVS